MTTPRELFGDAEKEEKEKGIASKLHIIIFDEIDAICKKRGTMVLHTLTISLLSVCLFVL